MSQALNLKEIERKAWTSFFQDGLYDIWLGWLLLQMGGVYLLSKLNISDPIMTVINLGVYLLSFLLLYLTKCRITLPRLGRVKFGPRRRSRVMTAGVITFIMVALTFSLTLLAVARQKSLLGVSLSPLVSPILLGMFLLIFFGLAAYFLDYKHLYLIALMFALPEPVLAIFQEYWSINLAILAWAVPSAVVVCMGLLTLRRFLHEYPVQVIPPVEV